MECGGGDSPVSHLMQWQIADQRVPQLPFKTTLKVVNSSLRSPHKNNHTFRNPVGSFAEPSTASRHPRSTSIVLLGI
jgi:hypothetical protein